jgi:hypothetical protein
MVASPWVIVLSASVATRPVTRMAGLMLEEDAE